MNIVTLKTDYMGSNIYLIIEDNHAVIIDPSNYRVIEEYVNDHSLIIDIGILTHEHCDHSYEVGTIREKYKCPIIASSKCSDRLMSSQKNFSAHYSAMLQICGFEAGSSPMIIEPFSEKADSTFSESTEFNWNNHLFYLRETPGHTIGSICILVDNKALFTGDSLFFDQPVSLRFPSGSKKQYEEETIPWFNSLTGDIHVYPGHYESFDLSTRLLYPLV